MELFRESFSSISSPLERKYDPNNYDEVLAGYLTRAYEAYDQNNIIAYESLCSQITMELKTLWKCQMISKIEADEIKDYFWSFVG